MKQLDPIPFLTTLKKSKIDSQRYWEFRNKLIGLHDECIKKGDFVLARKLETATEQNFADLYYLWQEQVTEDQIFDVVNNYSEFNEEVR